MTVTFDRCFVVRNIKIIDGTHGLFVAMPSRKPKAACPRCAFKNDAGGRFCVQCGSPVPPARLVQQPGRAAITTGGPGAIPPVSRPEGQGGVESRDPADAHRDIAHPITADFRQVLQQHILEAYEAERAKERRPETGAADETA